MTSETKNKLRKAIKMPKWRRRISGMRFYVIKIFSFTVMCSWSCWG